MTLTTPPRRALLQAGIAAASVAFVSHACTPRNGDSRACLPWLRASERQWLISFGQRLANKLGASNWD